MSKTNYFHLSRGLLQIPNKSQTKSQIDLKQIPTNPNKSQTKSLINLNEILTHPNKSQSNPNKFQTNPKKIAYKFKTVEISPAVMSLVPPRL